MERIGIVGLGRMGQAMAGRLLEAGFPVVAHNRTPARAEALLRQGAAWANSPAELTEQTGIILTSLTDDRAVEQVYLGARGLVHGQLENRLLIEMSTIRVATIHRLLPAVEARGGRLLDAPVSGSLEPARRGELLALVGGQADDLARARPVLDRLARRVVHLGPSGAGTAMKLVLNMPMAIFWAGLGEAMAMGRQFGLTVEQMLDIFLDSPVALPALRGKAPLLLGAEHEVAFDVTGVRKDLLAMIATAQEVGVPTPAGSAALAEFAAATVAGYGQRDLTFVIEYLMEAARLAHDVPPAIVPAE